MFHRRLLLLLAVMVFATGVLAARLVRLTLVEGPGSRQGIEGVLISSTVVNTVRGRIYDGKGVLLAADVPSADIAVDFAVITGRWAYKQAERVAINEHKSDWSDLSVAEREDLIEEYRGPFDAELEEVWRSMARMSGVEREEIERRKASITRYVHRLKASVNAARARSYAKKLGRSVSIAEFATEIAEETIPHTVLAAVSDEVANGFQKVEGQMPGVKVIQSKSRLYNREMTVTLNRSRLPSPIRSEGIDEFPLKNVGVHLLGSMRPVWAEDVNEAGDGRGNPGRPFVPYEEGRDLGGYKAGDMKGLGGIEAAAENELRGSRGIVQRRLDTGEEVNRIPLVEGGDATLTVDWNLQARVRAIMEPDFGLMRVQPFHTRYEPLGPIQAEMDPPGSPLCGAAVVLDVDSGEILALVSTPAPPARVIGEPYSSDPANDPDNPLINKPLGAIYAPGSTVKPLVYTIAVNENEISPDRVFDCRGQMFEDIDNAFRCWGWRPDQGAYLRHGELDGVEAIRDSCNIYFYNCGRMLGGFKLIRGFGLWGFGEKIGLGFGPHEEVEGSLPRLAGVGVNMVKLDEAMMMSIGQSRIAVPPIQVGAAHVALARGGEYISPTLIRDRGEPEIYGLGIDARVIRNALEGMRRAAAPDHLKLRLEDESYEPILTVPGVEFYAKTGTAQNTPLWRRQRVEREDGRVEFVRVGDMPYRDNTHSWIVCHVRPRGSARAKFVVVVLVEYGGSGSRVAGPVANQIVWALKDEGYF
ncbi:MAG: penicillin-binding transpeptidase domain-containing protein [Planctomycetota bacterium]|jgi:cell division protein FtsI/penicillin-binding protein 2